MPNIGHVIGPTIMLFFIALVLIIAILVMYNYFNTRLRMRTAQDILKDNKDFTPQQIRALFQKEHNTDFRKGFIGIALALGSIVFGLVMGSNDYSIIQTSFIGMSIFPGLIGLSYLYFHYKIK